jgi:5-methylcytosine-specific restriction endonuclease McrA
MTPGPGRCLTAGAKQPALCLPSAPFSRLVGDGRRTSGRRGSWRSTPCATRAAADTCRVGYVDPLRSRARARHRKPVFPQTDQVELDGATDEPPHFRQRPARNSDTGKIRDVGAVTSCASFDDDEVVHRDHLRPAVFRMLCNVPGGTSAEGWPATVSRPVFPGCLSWRWEPSTTTSCHPSARSSRSRSRTFTGDCLATPARRLQPRLQ